MRSKALVLVLVLILELVAVTLATAGPAAVPPADDLCAALENSMLAEPDWYAERCGRVKVQEPPVADTSLAPTDLGYALNLRGGFDELNSFLLNNFAGLTDVGPQAANIYGMDFDATATILYGLQDTNQFGTFNLATAAFTPIGTSTPPTGHTWGGMAIHPLTNVVYALSNVAGGAALNTIDPATGAATLLTPITGMTLPVAIAMNCAGQMYGHDIGTDSIYTINMTTGAATLVGATGVNSNFAQGMDFDNDTGTLYAWTYQGTGNNQYGTINLATGALTAQTVNNPIGEWEGATQTTCSATLNMDQAVQSASGLVAPGDPLTYTLTISNTGFITATATVTDVFPAEVANVSCTGSGAAGGYGTVVGNINDTLDIGPGAVGTYTCNAEASAAAACAGTVTNQATISSPQDPNSPVTSSSSFNAACGGLEVSKTAASATVALGSPITFTIELTNTGNVPLSDIVLTDTWDACMDCTLDDPSGPLGSTLPPMGTAVLTMSCATVATAPTCTNTIDAGSPFWAPFGVAQDNAADSVDIQPATAVTVGTMQSGTQRDLLPLLAGALLAAIAVGMVVRHGLTRR